MELAPPLHHQSLHWHHFPKAVAFYFLWAFNSPATLRHALSWGCWTPCFMPPCIAFPPACQENQNKHISGCDSWWIYKNQSPSAGSHFSLLSDHVTPGKRLVRTISVWSVSSRYTYQEVITLHHLWYLSQVLTGLQEEEYHTWGANVMAFSVLSLLTNHSWQCYCIMTDYLHVGTYLRQQCLWDSEALHLNQKRDTWRLPGRHIPVI